MVMYVERQDVRFRVNSELSVCGQVLRRSRKAGVRSGGGGGALPERKRNTECVCITTTKSTRDLFEFACPLLE